MMKVAAYQAPLLEQGSLDAIDLIAQRIRECEAAGVQIVSCPEAILGGLADHTDQPHRFALAVEGGQLAATLAPLASDSVTTIIGFTEIATGGRLHNSAAVYQKGAIVGVYRKLYPAMNRSVYEAGDEMPVFTVGDLTFGIAICNDTNYFEVARIMAARGAAVLFVPTNNALPRSRAKAELVEEARNVDIARAIDNRVSIIRSDVCGSANEFISHGSSAIIDFQGTILQAALPMKESLLIADIDVKPRRRRGWDVSKNRTVAQEYSQLVAREYRTDGPGAR